MAEETHSGEKRKRESSPISSTNAGTGSSPRIIGPTPQQLPGGNSNNFENQSNTEDTSDESDDDFGPKLPSAAGPQVALVKHDDVPNISKKPQHSVSEATSPKLGRRDEWMVVPPSRDSWASGMHSTAIQNRRFMTGRSARGSEVSDGTGSAWTESPSQKKLRLENEILGVQPNSSSAEIKAQPQRADITTAEKLKRSRAEEKKPSLYETHRQRPQDTGTDDPSARPFDREKDIAGPANISNANRKEMLNRASDYGSRFSGGKYL